MVLTLCLVPSLCCCGSRRHPLHCEPPLRIWFRQVMHHFTMISSTRFSRGNIPFLSRLLSAPSLSSTSLEAENNLHTLSSSYLIQSSSSWRAHLHHTFVFLYHLLVNRVRWKLIPCLDLSHTHSTSALLCKRPCRMTLPSLKSDRVASQIGSK